MTVFFLLIFSLYIFFVLFLNYQWNAIPQVKLNQPAINNDLQISVIIPVRNEEVNILNLLSDLNSQEFDKEKFEVIVVDDHSTDSTAALIKQFAALHTLPIKLLFLTETSSKKQAIALGIENATGELIITTDGDCRVGRHWLLMYSTAYTSSGFKICSGPVAFNTDRSIFGEIQQLEFVSLIGSGASMIKAGYPTMCNGANLAYTKEAFEEVNGFEGNEHITSGDDEFLLHKIFLKHPEKIHVLKSQEALVTTSANRTLKGFIAQRQRWAGKWKYYQLPYIKWVALFVFSVNLLVITGILLSISGLIESGIFLLLLFTKITVEFVFLKNVEIVLGQKSSLITFILLTVLYPFYVCYVALMSTFSSDVHWKGRKIQST